MQFVAGLCASPGLEAMWRDQTSATISEKRSTSFGINFEDISVRATFLYIALSSREIADLVSNSIVSLATKSLARVVTKLKPSINL